MLNGVIAEVGLKFDVERAKLTGVGCAASGLVMAVEFKEDVVIHGRWLSMGSNEDEVSLGKLLSVKFRRLGDSVVAV